MKKYLSMILFVFVMGIVSSGILISVNALTKDRIAANAELVWKDAVLTHHGIAHDQNDFNEKFEEFITSETKESTTGESLTAYFDDNGVVSFRFFGYGLWGPIEGVITLESNFKTIVAITITDQAETPGLGGVVAERAYLNKYVGKQFDDILGLSVVKDTPNQDYEVDAIVGATGTSTAFGGILNTAYRKYYALFSGADELGPIKKVILAHNSIEYTENNFGILFDENFDTETMNELTRYINKTNGNISFIFSHGPGYDSAVIEGVITLQSDFITIVNISVTQQTEQRGAIIQTDPNFFDGYIGKKFNPDLVAVRNPSADNEVDINDYTDADSNSGITLTRVAVMTGLNRTYLLYYNTFKGLDLKAPLKKALLKDHQITFTDENYNDLYNSSFDIESKDNLTIYTNIITGKISFIFSNENGFGGYLEGLITLESDFITISKVSILEHSENRGHIITTNPNFFANYVGKKFNPNIIAVKDPTADNEVDSDDYYNTDNETSLTATMNAVIGGMNTAYQLHYQAFYKDLSPLMKAALTANDIAFDDTNFKSLFDSSFEINRYGSVTVYTNTNSENISFSFKESGFAGEIQGLVTIQSDYMTIVKVTIVSHSENRGASIMNDPNFFDSYIGKKFNPNIIAVENPTADNEVDVHDFDYGDGVGGLTKTKDGVIGGMNAAYQIVYNTFKGGN